MYVGIDWINKTISLLHPDTNRKASVHIAKLQCKWLLWLQCGYTVLDIIAFATGPFVCDSNCTSHLMVSLYACLCFDLDYSVFMLWL